MGMVSAALGSPVDLVYDGKTYKLSPWSYDIQSSYERYLEGEAVAALKRLRPYLTEDEYREQLSETRRDVGAGLYTFGSDIVAKAIWAKPHFKHLVWLCLQKNHPEATKDLVSKMVDDQLDEVFAKMNEANADPSVPPTTTPTPAGPAVP